MDELPVPDMDLVDQLDNGADVLGVVVVVFVLLISICLTTALIMIP